VRRLLNNQDGATAIEYAFIALLVFVVLFAGVVSLGRSNNDGWTTTADKSSNAIEKSNMGQ